MGRRYANPRRRAHGVEQIDRKSAKGRVKYSHWRRDQTKALIRVMDEGLNRHGRRFSSFWAIPARMSGR
ncbi:hypothetical protein AA23498_0408 [Acetobacter nitrogenifigens DSM 23921 = NBRC 105050]|uniref:Uncharacterized protein n=1 Tax=Acetobacter nitrogenifigens DSM 23921 = NBRC 105050 TaxID=1120919 RepID=A0A511XBT7_9PROT|nr:hypothetical protein AA23498_0408 [Acetobacter nitrogenifigens DSM 23921 = NBRC 105050]GEN60437.1 hypothetical protein ANI02nite_23210 [Acetobacter nitrogenifigens DSM 23921 = NBRC 105050]